MKAVAAGNPTHLEPVPEDETAVLLALAANSKHNLLDSKHAFPRPQGLLLNKTRAALASKSPNATAIKRQPAPESQKELADTMKTINFHDTVLKTFRQKTESLAKSNDDLTANGVATELSKVRGNTGTLACDEIVNC